MTRFTVDEAFELLRSYANEQAVDMQEFLESIRIVVADYDEHQKDE